MFAVLRSLFRELLPEEGGAGAAETRSIQLAIASLLCEVSRADNHYDVREETAKIHLIRHLLTVDENTAQQLLAQARRKSEEAVSLFDFTNKLRTLSHPQRFELIKAMWQVAYADGVLDPQEEAIIRQVSDLIYLDHPEFIRAKLAAQENS
ncbi:TerB family tellurite resistance protein [Tolumonas lignilytica]|jgi:Uncharacterized protein conserved in bacteria|uniref:tellurite resistance TerB family protein n=1 Tax=Tolumonas lignilytica TaxID=1283284 RepID=UPI0004679524|nr:TerB family tellurite resistance protein [Tolumonas lignilytica]